MSKTINTDILTQLIENIDAKKKSDPNFQQVIEKLRNFKISIVKENFHFASDNALKIIKELLGDYFGKNSQCIKLQESWNNVENVFYASDDYYRDHILHAFNTFILGLSIGVDLGIFTPKGNLNKEKDWHNWYRLNTNQMLLTWQFAAFFHDVGYPIEKAEIIGKNLREKYFKFIPQFSVNDLQVLIPQRMPSQKNEDCISEITKGFLQNGTWSHNNAHYNLDSFFQESLFNKNHGIVSAYMLWQIAFIDRKMNKNLTDDELKNIMRFACTAMALHTMYFREEFSFLRIKIQTLPLSMLLIICDELQEWDRPYGEEKLNMKIRRKNYERELKFKSINASENNKKIDIKITCSASEPDTEKLNKKYQKIFRIESIANNQVEINIDKERV